MKLLAKPAVDDWRVEQAIRVAIRAGKYLGKTEDEMVEQVGQALDTELDKARDFGTAVHSGVEHVSLHHTLPTSLSEANAKLSPVMPWIKAFKDWKDKYLTKIYGAEVTVVNRSLGYAGRVDLHACHAEHGDVVIDFKTQNVKKRPVFYEEWSYQLAAYHVALPRPGTELGRPGRCMSLVIDSNPGARVHEKLWGLDEVAHGWECFWSILNAWQRVRKYNPTAVQS